MRYRRYYASQKRDGSVSVFSHGPFIGFYRLLYPFVMIALVVCFNEELFDTHYTTALIFFAAIGVFTPSLRGVQWTPRSALIVKLCLQALALVAMGMATVGVFYH